MKKKLVIFCTICLFFLIQKTVISDEMCPGIIRVGISSSDFSNLEYSDVNLSADTEYYIFSNSEMLLTLKPNELLNIKVENGSYILAGGEKTVQSDMNSALQITTNNRGLISLEGLKRRGKPAKYRGNIEISKTKNNKFNVINIIDVEDYLKGVVPNEMPVRFGLEALKAQAVAARNYVFRPRTKSYNNFDVCDSVQSQVYFGANTEDAISNRAVDETKGLFSIYDDEITLALYSSTAGGYTESFENAFSDPVDLTFPSRSIPYLKAVADIPSSIDLTDEVNATNFYKTNPQSFENESNYFRWVKTWQKSVLEKILQKNLLKYSNAGFVKPKFTKDSVLGSISDIKVLQRGISGKAMFVQITTDKGQWTVSKELMIRRIFENGGGILPSANVIFELSKDTDGNLVSICAYGGGLGHGVGMSQYGAGYLSKNGANFNEILQHYYKGVSIGTKPINIDLNKPQSFQAEFYSPDAQGTLIIKNPREYSGYTVMVNSFNLNIDTDIQKTKNIMINIDGCLNKGINNITILPSSQKNYSRDNVSRKIKFYVEVFKPQNE